MLKKMRLKDKLIVVLRDKNGNVKHRYDSGWRENTITNSGKAEVAGLICADVGGTAFDYIAIGTGTTPESATDTALENETHRIGGGDVTGSLTTTTVTNDTVQLVGTFSGYTGTESITESGVFNASSGGIMLCRQTFDPVNVNWDAGDSLQIVWKIKVA